MTLGQEYSNDYAHFIAGGSTLDAIKKYEADKENVQGMYADIVKDLGAKDFSGMRRNPYFSFAAAVENPALTFAKQDKSGDYVYSLNATTPEGRALQDKLKDVPDFDLGQRVFAKRVTGAEQVSTNPDNLDPGYGYQNSHYGENALATSATFSKYGDTYVVSVPRTVRGIFNEASAKASKEDHYEQAAGYTYEWWIPPDSTPIPYSKVIELQEKEKGDQLAPRSVTRKVPTPGRS